MKRLSRWLMWVLVAAMLLAPVGAQAALNLHNYESLRLAYSNYYTCAQGDSGSNVLNIKERLKYLGYYSETATFDDQFNSTMVERVKLFQENNGLSLSGKVDSKTIDKLKSTSAVPGKWNIYTSNEPDVTAIIPMSSSGQWKDDGGYYMDFRLKIKNVSTYRKIVAVEFEVYTKDIWGDELISSANPYTYTAKVSATPGEMCWTEYMSIPDRREVYEIHIAVKRVRYADGTTESVSDPHYVYWTID